MPPSTMVAVPSCGSNSTPLVEGRSGSIAAAGAPIVTPGIGLAFDLGVGFLAGG